MTRVQFAALLSAAGVGFVGGATLDFKPGPPATATFIHTLRIEEIRAADGGTKDFITAYRTRATHRDGGMDLLDIGPSTCTGNTAPARTWVGDNCLKEDGGQVKSVYVIEARPAGSDDGGAGEVAVEIYGDEAVRCTLAKPAAFRTFLGSLNCVDFPRKSTGAPL